MRLFVPDTDSEKATMRSATGVAAVKQGRHSEWYLKVIMSNV